LQLEAGNGLYSNMSSKYNTENSQLKSL